jgi:hypothetical protein
MKKVQARPFVCILVRREPGSIPLGYNFFLIFKKIMIGKNSMKLNLLLAIIVFLKINGLVLENRTWQSQRCLTCQIGRATSLSTALCTTKNYKSGAETDHKFVTMLKRKSIECQIKNLISIFSCKKNNFLRNS